MKAGRKARWWEATAWQVDLGPWETHTDSGSQMGPETRAFIFTVPTPPEYLMCSSYWANVFGGTSRVTSRTPSASCVPLLCVSVHLLQLCLAFWLAWPQRTAASQWLHLTASYAWRLLITYLSPLASSSAGCRCLSWVTWNKKSFFGNLMVLCSLKMFSFIWSFFRGWSKSF